MTPSPRVRMHSCIFSMNPTAHPYSRCNKWICSLLGRGVVSVHQHIVLTPRRETCPPPPPPVHMTPLQGHTHVQPVNHEARGNALRMDIGPRVCRSYFKGAINLLFNYGYIGCYRMVQVPFGMNPERRFTSIWAGSSALSCEVMLRPSDASALWPTLWHASMWLAES